jgi:hypothetical protein
MPEVSGFELCRSLSFLSITKHISIFIVSGIDEKNTAYCQNLGAVGYVTKPIDFATLKANLAKVIQSRGAERRADVRVALRVTLRLKGKSRTRAYFEVHASTENVSRGGFLCSCASSLDSGQVTKELMNIPDNIPQKLLKKTDCVVVFPSVLKAAFIVRVLKPAVEGLLAQGRQGADVGDKLRVKLIGTDVERGYVDFARDQMA